MKIGYKIKSLVAVILAAILIFMLLPIQQAHASEVVEIPNSDISLRVISNDKVEVIEGDTVNEITVENVNDEITEIRISEPGESESVFVANSAEGTLTTDEGITINALDGEEENLTEEVTTAAYSSKTTTKKYSYAKIKKALKDTATVATIAGIVIGLLAAAGFAVPEMLPALIDMIGKIVDLLAMVNKGSSKHGLKVKLKSYMRTSTKNGKKYRYEAWKIISAGTY